MCSHRAALAIMAASIGALAPLAPAVEIAHSWKLNESSGAAALDSIGGGTGALGGTSAWSAGRLSNGFNTTGSNLGYVNAGPVAVNGSFSVSFWVKPENVALDYRNMISKHDGGAGSKSFWIGQNAADGSLRFGMYFDGTTETALDTATPVVSNGNWAFVTASWNEATREQSIYVDGVLRASATRTGASFAAPRGSNLLFNTNSATATSSPGVGSWARFPGTVDDVSIWSGAMSAGAVKALYNTAETPGFGGFDAQTFDAVHRAYSTNFAQQLGNVRWSRATDMNLTAGAVQQRPNGFAMQLDAGGAGVTALSVISLSFDPKHPNLADTTNGNTNAAGSDAPAIHVFANGTSEIDGLTSNTSIGSADVRPDTALTGDVLVMLWLTDTQGADDRAALRAELSGAGGSVYSILDSSSADWARLMQSYAGFDTLIRFEDASLVGAINWDFATHADVVVDQIAVSVVPEPGSIGIIALAGVLLRRRPRHRQS